MEVDDRGLNDGALGALLPSLETYYDLNYAIVSLIFLSTACGFILASFLAFQLHSILGRCKSLVIGTSLQASCYVVLSTHPPYPGVVFGFFLAGSGMGFMLAHCNTYMVLILWNCVETGNATKFNQSNGIYVLLLWHWCYFSPLNCDSASHKRVLVVDILFYHACPVSSM